MIHESRYWKVPLLRSATWLEKIRVSEEEPEVALARAEREVFIGCYAIRKLLETFKLSPSTRRFFVDLKSFDAIDGAHVDYFNKYDIDEHYNMESPRMEQRNIGLVCNQIIHSFVFVIGTAENRSLEGFFVTSDAMRHKKLFFLSLGSLTSMFRMVGRDYPQQQKLVRNSADQWEDASDAP